MAIQFITNETIDKALFYWKKENPTKAPEGIIMHYHDYYDLEEYIGRLEFMYKKDDIALSPKYAGLKIYRTEDIDRNTIKIL